MASKARLKGDWGRLRKINNLTKPLFLNPTAQAQLREIGNEILDAVLKNIINESLPLAPHSPNYHGNPDGAILYRKGQWVNKLAIEEVAVQQNGLIMFIGGKSGDSFITDKGEAIPMDVFTDWIENGTINQPPRPAIKLTWEEIRPDIAKRVIAILQEELRRQTW